MHWKRHRIWQAPTFWKKTHSLSKGILGKNKNGTIEKKGPGSTRPLESRDFQVKDNVISLTNYAKIRNEERRIKFLKGIDRKKIQTYYKEFITPSISHMTLLQRFIVDGFCMDVLFLYFVLGVDASRRCMMGEDKDEVVEKTFEQNLQKLPAMATQMNLHQYIEDWELHGVFVLAEEIAATWLLEGIQYGIKQRKMRLL